MRQRCAQMDVRGFARVLLFRGTGKIQPHQQCERGLRAVAGCCGAEDLGCMGGNVPLQVRRQRRSTRAWRTQ